MPQLFTVRWPRFARLEAILLFPAVVLLSSETAMVRSLGQLWLVPTLSSMAEHAPVAKPAIPWAAAAIIAAVPYFIALLVADRLLTVRKGYVLLSVAAIGVWVFVGARFTQQWMAMASGSFLDSIDGPDLDRQASLAAGCVAFLAHLRPLWIGIRDQGDVAAHLISMREEYAIGRGSTAEAMRALDVYQRQTADFRGWRPQEQLEGLTGVPRENSAVKFLYAVAWIGVVVGLGTGWYHWDNFAGATRNVIKVTPVPAVKTGISEQPRINRGQLPLHPIDPPIAPAPTPGQAPLPSVVRANAPPPPPMPVVQRPGELSASLQSANNSAGYNEAVSDRGRDGSFTFDAVVNGARMPMIFDTGASVVALRAEDASRIGIDIDTLRYSAKVKTANGTADVAPIILETITIGNITQRNVAGFVAKQGALQVNLLGQAFLARLSGYNVEKNHLVLRGN
jgi:clan AA aspartic protease (TIGR02281 family)